MIGPTGSGKSTTILFLSGAKMKELQENGVYHIGAEEKDITNPHARSIKSNPMTESVTKYITAVPIPSGKGGKQIVLCDTPGFGDTNGPEVDIANGIGVIRAIQNCKSVRPIVLIS